MKVCPRCQVDHLKIGTFCSRACANSRSWSDADKLKKSIVALSSAAIKESGKNKRVLTHGQFGPTRECLGCRELTTRRFCTFACYQTSQWKKDNLSLKLKESHANGHPGWSHKNDDPKRRTYPERWFASAIINDDELSTYNVVEQLHVGKYWIDFAFMNQRIAVEIDGSQHDLPDVRAKDKVRDAYLTSQGWTMHRMPWKAIFANPQDMMMQLKLVLRVGIEPTYPAYDAGRLPLS